jgi:hypothetical protein
MMEQRGPLEKFVDSPYYSELEFWGGAVTVSFSKCLPWQAMHLLQRSPTSRKRKRSNKVSSRTFQMVLVFTDAYRI